MQHEWLISIHVRLSNRLYKSHTFTDPVFLNYYFITKNRRREIETHLTTIQKGYLVHQNGPECKAARVAQPFGGGLAMCIENTLEMLIKILNRDGTELVEDTANLHPSIRMGAVSPVLLFQWRGFRSLGTIDSLVERPAEIRAVEEPVLKEGHLTFNENQRGVCYDDLFDPYFKDAKRIVVTEAYIRLFFQARNLMELLETVTKLKSDEVEVHLVTAEDEFSPENQLESFRKMQENLAPTSIQFDWEFVDGQSIHAWHIVTDHGWKIMLDWCLEIFHRFEMNDTFAITNRLQ